TQNPTNLVTTQLIAPQAFIDALPQIATQPVAGQLGGPKPGASVSMDRFVVTVGSVKAGSSMPSWGASDPACGGTNLGRQTQCETTCVSDCASTRDDDADGYPGVTLQVCGFTDSDTAQGVSCNSSMPDVPGATLQGKAFVDVQVDPQFKG